MITFATGCSGIGAPEVAWGRLGWKSLWCSEIEPFPSAVLKHHWPTIPNHGDFNKLSEKILRQDIPAPDVFIAGTPCQAFSLAGLRESLNDERGNLTLKYVEIINAIDAIRIRAGLRPAIAVWENVPGVLSTKDNAFGCFLGGLAGSDEAVVPGTAPEAGKNSKYWRWDKTICKHIPKWSSAGVVFGTQRTVAWRTLDAQFFGVAQRRRRVFVVASSGAFDPKEVLFEFDGVSGDSAESREKRKSVAGTVETGAYNAAHETGKGFWKQDSISGTIRSASGHKPEQGVVWPRDVAATIDASYGRLFGCDNQHVDAGCPNFVMTTGQCNAEISKEKCPTLNYNHEAPILFESHPNDSRVTGPVNVAPTISSRFGTGGGNTPLVQVACIPLDLRNALRDPDKKDSINRQGCGIGEPGDPANTLSSANCHGVISFHPTQDPISHKDISHALGCGSSNGQCSSAVCIQGEIADGRRQNQNGNGVQENTSYTLNTATVHAVSMRSIVRRLTPLECERLQGFPDNHTNIPWKGKPEAPDSLRYKATGNSMARPAIEWLGLRIQKVIGE